MTRRRWSDEPDWPEYLARVGEAPAPQPPPPRVDPGILRCGWCGNDPDNCGCAADERLERWDR